MKKGTVVVVATFSVYSSVAGVEALGSVNTPLPEDFEFSTLG